MNRTRGLSVTPRMKSHPANMMSAGKRKSLRLQHSMSLQIPIEDLDNSSYGLNHFIDLPRQVFSLTYLEDNQTQNPDSLNSLEELRKKTWQTYLVGYLYNFTYEESQIESLQRSLNVTLSTEVPNSNTDLKYISEVAVTEDLSPTENDCNALVITVSEVLQELDSSDCGKSKELFKGYLLSWCNPVKTSTTLLPVLLCFGRKKIRTVVLDVLSKRFDVIPRPLTLMQEDIVHLSTYCLIMLRESDSGSASLRYKIPPGLIDLVVPVPNILNLWSHIHPGDTSDVDLEEVLRFHDALENFCETALGIKLDGAQFQQMNVKGFFSINVNSRIWSSSTRIIHVLLKYLNYMAVQRLKVKTLEQIHQPSNVSSNQLMRIGRKKV